MECLASHRALDSVIREHKSSRNVCFFKKIEHHQNDISWSERADPNHVWSDSFPELKIPLLMFVCQVGQREHGTEDSSQAMFLSFHCVSSADWSLVFRTDHSSLYTGAPCRPLAFPLLLDVVLFESILGSVWVIKLSLPKVVWPRLQVLLFSMTFRSISPILTSVLFCFSRIIACCVLLE